MSAWYEVTHSHGSNGLPGMSGSEARMMIASTSRARTKTRTGIASTEYARRRRFWGRASPPALGAPEAGAAEAPEEAAEAPEAGPVGVVPLIPAPRPAGRRAGPFRRWP